MRQSVTLLLAKHFLKNVFASAAVYVVGVLMMILLAFAAASGWKQYVMQNKLRQHYQQVARESWEGNPDKHPHRMAHYGTFAFRLKHPLTVFDFGIENFLGNAVFLEAHKTNTVNFSEASFSTSLVRSSFFSLGTTR
jgi:ABC-2 type transport system permease protein